jgi:hypothetical protein
VRVAAVAVEVRQTERVPGLVVEDIVAPVRRVLAKGDDLAMTVPSGAVSGPREAMRKEISPAARVGTT